MGTITTKYDIGDVVFHSAYSSEQRSHPCPDCLGAREWETKSPAGQEYKFPCPRCTSVYQSHKDLCLEYFQYTPEVRRLTIGQIQPGHGGGIEYMCHETGIGSGTVYKEASLHETEEKATEASKLLVAEMNSTDGGVAKLSYDKSLQVCDYQLSNAVLKSARDVKSATSASLQNLLEDIRSAVGEEEINEVLENFRFPD